MSHFIEKKTEVRKGLSDGQVNYRVRIGIQVYLLPVHISNFTASGSETMLETMLVTPETSLSIYPSPHPQHNQIIGKVGYSHSCLNDNCHILLKHVKLKSKSLTDEK